MTDVSPIAPGQLNGGSNRAKVYLTCLKLDQVYLTYLNLDNVAMWYFNAVIKTHLLRPFCLGDFHLLEVLLGGIHLYTSLMAMKLISFCESTGSFQENFGSGLQLPRVNRKICCIYRTRELTASKVRI